MIAKRALTSSHWSTMNMFMWTFCSSTTWLTGSWMIGAKMNKLPRPVWFVSPICFLRNVWWPCRQRLKQAEKRQRGDRSKGKTLSQIITISISLETVTHTGRYFLSAFYCILNKPMAYFYNDMKNPLVLTPKSPWEIRSKSYIAYGCL